MSDDPRALLDTLVADRGESLAALSRVLGRNPAYLQQYVRRGTPRVLAEADRKLLARYLGVDEAVLGGAESPSLVALPRLDVAASAGPGRVVDDERAAASLGLDLALLRRLRVRPSTASLIRVEGESMLPTLADGDLILVDGGDRAPGAQPRLYVVRLDEVLMVKRVTRHARGYDLASDNPDAVSPGRLPADRVEVIGRVAWLGRALV